MSKTRMIFIALAVLLATATGFLAGHRKGEGESTATVVRTYEVPPNRAEEVRSTLAKLFYQRDHDSQVAAVQVFGSGLVIVKAPEGFQPGIRRLIEQISSTKAAASDARIHLDYWLVLGEVAPKSNGETFGPLAPVLSSIDAVDGPRKFRVLEHIGSTSLSGKENKIKGNIVELRSGSRIAGDQVNLDLNVRSHAGEIEAETVAKPGEFIVLGQNALQANGSLHAQLKAPADWLQNPPNVYHVIRVDVQK